MENPYFELKKEIMVGVLNRHMDSYEDEVKKIGGENMPPFQSMGITRTEIYRAVGEFLEEKGITEEEYLHWLDEIRKKANETFLTEKLDEIVEEQRFRDDKENEEY